MRISATLLLAGFLAAACAKPEAGTGGAPAVDSAAVRAGIDSTRAGYSRLQLAGDAAGLAQFFTEDATLDAYGAPRAKGRAAIEAGLQAELGMRKYTVSEINPVGVFPRTNEEASEIGTFHSMYDAGGTTNHEWGRYVVGLRKGSDGRWLLDYLMFFPDSTKAQ